MWYNSQNDMSLNLKNGLRKTLYILRGLSGSGKSTKARALGENGVVLGSDDFWGPEYNFDKSKIGEAHQWNQERVLDALQKGISPVVVDNTNCQFWEMKKYVEMAQEHGYDVEFQESDTPWKFDADELFARNTHGVPIEVIRQMLMNWEKNPTVEGVLKSRAPWEKTHSGDDIKSF